MTNHFCRTWVKVLAFCLFVLITALCFLSAAGTYTAYTNGWYFSQPVFAESGICKEVVSEDLSSIISSMYIFSSLDQLRLDEAFSYRIITESGRILADTTNKSSVYVTDYTLYPPYESLVMQDMTEAAFLEGYIDLPIVPAGGVRYYNAWRLFNLVTGVQAFFIPVLILSFILCIFLFTLLLSTAGKHADGEPGPRGLDKFPYELYCLGIFLLFVVWFHLTDYLSLNTGRFFFISFLIVGCTILATLFLMTTVARTRGGKFLRTTMTYWLIRGSGKFLRVIPLVWRTALCYLGYLFFNFIGAAMLFNGPTALGLFFLLLLNGFAGAVLIAYARDLRRLQKAGEELAAGNFAVQPDERLRFPDLKAHSSHLAGVGMGMNRALEDRMRSERMKTELITNVSHDLKTPLTSIVTYVDLLSCCPLEGEAKNYVSVLERQAHRLKKLTEDLVDASKAASGALQINPETLDLTELVHQAVGEYSQRLEDAGLIPMIALPEEPVRILSDSRYLWRVLDNLLSNAVKYTLSGTRIYISVHQENGWAVLTMKNISAAPLTVSGEELTERFVRGDASRSTEGSGLGLSITKSLVELMHGSLQIVVDGDLFKAIIAFPVSM